MHWLASSRHGKKVAVSISASLGSFCEEFGCSFCVSLFSSLGSSFFLPSLSKPHIRKTGHTTVATGESQVAVSFGPATHPWPVDVIESGWMNGWYDTSPFPHLATTAVKSQLVTGVSSTHKSAGSCAVSRGQRTDPVMVAPDFDIYLQFRKKQLAQLGQQEVATAPPSPESNPWPRKKTSMRPRPLPHSRHPGGETRFCPAWTLRSPHYYILKRHLKRLPAEVTTMLGRHFLRVLSLFFHQKVVKCFTAALLLMQRASGVVRIVGLCRNECMHAHPALVVSKIIT